LAKHRLRGGGEGDLNVSLTVQAAPGTYCFASWSIRKERECRLADRKEPEIQKKNPEQRVKQGLDNKRIRSKAEGEVFPRSKRVVQICRKDLGVRTAERGGLLDGTKEQSDPKRFMQNLANTNKKTRQGLLNGRNRGGGTIKSRGVTRNRKDYHSAIDPGLSPIQNVVSANIGARHGWTERSPTSISINSRIMINGQERSERRKK